MTGLATCPALAANVVWKGVRRKGGGGIGLAGGEDSACHVGQGGFIEIYDSQAQGRFNRAGMMASTHILPFVKAAEISVNLIRKNILISL